MKKFLTTTVATVSILSLALSGCSNPDSGETDSSGPITWAEQDADLAGTQLTIWTSDPSIGKTVFDAFEKATGAELNVVAIPAPYEQSIQTKVATGDKPDLAFWQPTVSQLTALNAKTNLQALNDAPWLDNYLPEYRDITGSLDGSYYGALINSPSVIGVYYNKGVFADNGITTTPANWQELVAAANTIKGSGVAPFFDAAGDKWTTQWWVQAQLAEASETGLWDRVNANEESFKDPTILGAIEEYKRLIDEGLFNDNIKTASFADQGEAILNGDAAMAIQVNSMLGLLQSTATSAELDEKVGFFPISAAGNIGSFIPEQANALVAFKTGDAKRESAARQLLSYWLGDGYGDYVKDTSSVSIQTGVETPAEVPEVVKQAADAVSTSVGSMQALAIANPDLYMYLSDMVFGAKTPKEVAEATQKQFSELGKAQGAKNF